ncbi:MULTISPECIES: tripartite tricarboxylate transporter permease [unclassified Yoonia]|uniref:tripartite tricarboxylate transporter permease n=1 Tax=unclassified Yoonia TaxID=2629118 RepID=UPI002AFDFA20|nr:MULTISPECIES: tripartite tricarboxylate transporter permease [unclassified Yoonia]
MDLGAWAQGFAVALTGQNLLLCFTGAVLGTLVGVLPGIGPAATLALLLPLTFALDPTGAIIMMAAIYYGAQYGGSTTSILLNVPGECSGVVTALDGHKMALAGRAGPAIAIAALASLFAGLATAVMVATVAAPLSTMTTAIAPAGLVGLIALGLFAAAVISPGPVLPALALILIGAGLGLVGTDLAGGMPRFTFGIPELRDGIGFVPLVMGLFGLAELIRALETGGRPERIRLVRWPWPTRADLRAGWVPTLRGTAIGSVLGVIPGATTLLAALAARGVENGFRTKDQPLGSGAVAGVAAPEAANNAAAQSALVPLLTLGLPGSPVMAVLAGALMIHAIVPGPGFIAQNPDLFTALMASLIVGNIILVVLNLPLAGVWASLLRIPFRRLVPMIIVISLIGVHSVQNSLFDVWLMLGFGVFGWVLLRLGLEPTPLVLGFILGPAFEEYLRRTLLFSRGDATVLLTDPVSAVCLSLIAAATVWKVGRLVGSVRS